MMRIRYGYIVETQMIERQRIEQEYQRRACNSAYSTLYTALNPASLHALHSRERALLALLQRHGITDLTIMRVLDIGCGSGGELLRWIGYGCTPAHCVGIDLMPDRIARARQRLPEAVQLQRGDASLLPYRDASVDIITQFTVFSSILEPCMRQAIAAEMLRVLCPGGMIVWYDFWLNPTNQQTQGIHLNEIKRLFPNCHYDPRCITLAPPLARRIVPHSWLFASLLEKLPLRTHWLVGIRKPVSTQ